MKKLFITIAFISTIPAYATRAPHNCEPKTSEPPAVSKPEPKSAPSRTGSDHDKPCERGVLAPHWCNLEGKK